MLFIFSCSFVILEFIRLWAHSRNAHQINRPSSIVRCPTFDRNAWIRELQDLIVGFPLRSSCGFCCLSADFHKISMFFFLLLLYLSSSSLLFFFALFILCFFYHVYFVIRFRYWNDIVRCLSRVHSSIGVSASGPPSCSGQFWLRLQITTMHHSGVLAEANGLFGNGFYYNNNMIFAIVCVTCWIGSALVEMYLDFFVCLYHASVLWTSSAVFTHTHKPWKKEHTKIRKNRKKYTVLMWTTTYIDI